MCWFMLAGEEQMITTGTHNMRMLKILAWAIGPLNIAYNSVNSFIFISSCIYPPCLIISQPIVSIMFVYASVARILINWSLVWGHTKIPGGECHRHEKGFGNEMKQFRISIIFRGSVVDAARYADKPWQFQCACEMVFLPQIGADDHDITMWHHEDLSHYWGREIEKGEHYQTRGAAIIWVFGYKAFGSISKPQTLYLSCLSALLGGSITKMHSIAHLSIHMHPDLHWRTL